MAREKITFNGDENQANETEQAKDAELRIVAGKRAEAEDQAILQLRPRGFDEYVGQQNVMHSLKIAVKAAVNRGEPVDHVLFHGPPGLGKTTLAHIIAREMGVRLEHTSGPALERPADMVGLLSNLEAGAVLFIDEIHRLSSSVEEYLYSAMEDYRVDFVTGSGAYAKTLSFPLQPFTLVGATTRAGLLSSPLRDRFGMVYHMEYYSDEELTSVVKRSAGILDVEADSEGAAEIARRSRGTPRIANRLLRRVRDFTQVEADGRLSQEVASAALNMEGVDSLGLDRLDRLYLKTLAHQYRGGPAGIAAIAATVNEEPQTLEDVVEPFLLKMGFIIRTPGGRRVTADGSVHAGVPPNASSQGTLL
ncbi:MAG: Holliday junction branch migration DNA helicase RuvB [Dehalococcoidia bacterium]